MNKRITVISLAVFSMFLTLSIDFQNVYALEIIQKATGDAPRSVYTYQTGDLTAVLNSNDDTVSVYNTNSGALIRTINLSTGWTGLGAGVANHIACSVTICITTVDTSTTDRAFAFNIATGSVGSISSGVNFTSSAPLSGSYGFEITCDIQCTMWIARRSAAPPAGTHFIRVYGETGGDVINNSWVFVAQHDTGLGTTSEIEQMERGTFQISGGTYNFIAYYYEGGNFRVINLGTLTQVCNIAMTASNTNADIVYSSEGSGDGEQFWFFNDLGSGVKKITHSSPSTCAVSNTIATTQFESNNAVALAYNTNNGDLYVYASSSIYVVNGTTFTTTQEFVTSTTGILDSMDYDSSLDTLAQAINTDDVINFFRFEGEFGEGEEGQAGTENGVCLNVDANGDGLVNVLDCAGQATAWSGFTSGQNATDVTASITDGLGLTNCGDNPDHETCGSGLFLFLFLLLLSEFLALAGYLGFMRLTSGEPRLVEIGLMILVIAFVDLAIGFYLNWIPDIVFYTIIVIVSGFLAFGLLRQFRGG